MTNEDMQAAAELIEDGFLNHAAVAEHRLSTKVADTEKTRKIEINAALFLKVLANNRGTFIWEGPNKGRKFSDPFQALAATMPGFSDCDFSEEKEFIEENAPKLSSGLYAARRWLYKWFGETIYFVPEDRESSRPTVITIDPNCALRSGKTAAEMQAERDVKLAKGQVRASSARLAASVKDKSEVETRMHELVHQAMADLGSMVTGLPER